VTGKIGRIDLLNWAAYSVSRLGKGGKHSSQLNQLLSVLSQGEGVDAIYLVLEHLVYQSAGRGDLLPREFSKQVFNDLCEIINSPYEDSEKVSVARAYLTHIKRLAKGAEPLGEMPKIQRDSEAFMTLAKKALSARKQSRNKRAGDARRRSR